MRIAQNIFYLLLLTIACTACVGSSETRPTPPEAATATQTPPPSARTAPLDPAPSAIQPAGPTPAPVVLLPEVACTGLTPSAAIHSTGSKRLSDASYLRKLSLHLRGITPNPSEYAALAQAADKEGFLETAIDQYIRSDRYQQRMMFRLSERFRVRPPEAGPAHALNTDTIVPDAMTDLFGRIAKDNFSWDEIFTATNYVAYPRNPIDAISPGDFGFFRGIFPQLPYENSGTYDPGEATDPTDLNGPATQPPLAFTPVNFPAGDLRVAGALTTSRFAARYGNTALNKNRRRAAAVYNIAFCDPMLPSVSSGRDPKHEFTDKAFADRYVVSEDEIHAGLTDSADSLHGSNPDCKACHMKLDPLGKTFQFNGVSLHPNPSSGALVLRRAGGEIFMQKVAGIGELARVMVRQPEYVDCQTRFLWTEFIGNDVPVTTARQNSLRCDFEASGRKANDFIKKIVTSQDFRIEPSDRGELLFNDVKDLLKRCDSCHASEDSIPVFSSLPILSAAGKDQSAMWISKIIRRMNLPEGNEKKMPKDAKLNWSEDDLHILQRWFQGGARDTDGKALISPETLKSLQPAAPK